MDSTANSTIRKFAAAGIIGGLATAASGVVIAGIVQPNSDVSDEMWSYPLTSDALAPVSTLYAVFHLCVFLGVLAFARSGHAGDSRSARVGGMLALAGTFLFFVAEFASIPFADQRMDDTGPMVVGSAFGLGVALTAVGLVTAGVATLRAGLWQGWRRYAPLAAGVWALVMIGISGRSRRRGRDLRADPHPPEPRRLQQPVCLGDEQPPGEGTSPGRVMRLPAGCGGITHLGPYGGSRSKSSKWNPGETTQLTSASSSPGRARCHTPAGTRACETWSAAVPTCTVPVGSGDGPSPPSSRRTTPVCASQTSSERTRCQAEDSPAGRRNQISVAVGRTRPSGSVTCASATQVCRNQPPSGCGSRASRAASSGTVMATPEVQSST
jgi:hypothetical protein